jgi:hypothetical protein
MFLPVASPKEPEASTATVVTINALALGPLGDIRQIGRLLFALHHPKLPSQVKLRS